MATIKEDYVSFEVARLLKEKGFDEPCHCLWINPQNSSPYNSVTGDIDGNVIKTYEDIDPKVIHQWYLCPTLQMAIKWLREIHDVDVSVVPLRSSKEYLPRVEGDIISYDGIPCKKYKKACEAAIKYCLENLI